MMLGAAGIASESRFAWHTEMVVAVAARIWELLDEAVTSTDTATMVVSGGSTPVPVYNTLRELPLPWDRMLVCPSDERWVGLEHEASNEGMLRRELFPAAAEPRVISLARQRDSAEQDAARVERALARRDNPWDLVILGMGTDGHTASLFPGASALALGLSSQRRCIAIEPLDAPHTRLTLTAPELLAARRVILIISGAEKWEVYREAVAGNDIEKLPVRAILHQKDTPVDVYWSAN